MLGGTIEKIDMNQYKKVRERGGGHFWKNVSLAWGCLALKKKILKDFYYQKGKEMNKFSFLESKMHF